MWSQRGPNAALWEWHATLIALHFNRQEPCGNKKGARHVSAPLPVSGFPKEFRLCAPYPNPFNATMTIAYDLPKAGHISLQVFDLLGREVAVLKDGFVESGSHRVTFDGSNLASGIYFTRLDAGEFMQTKKMLLLK